MQHIGSRDVDVQDEQGLANFIVFHHLLWACQVLQPSQFAPAKRAFSV